MYKISAEQIDSFIKCPRQASLTKFRTDVPFSSKADSVLLVNRIKAGYIHRMKENKYPEFRELTRELDRALYKDVDHEDLVLMKKYQRRGTLLFGRLFRWYHTYFIDGRTGYINLSLSHELFDGIEVSGMIDLVLIGPGDSASIVLFGDESRSKPLMLNSMQVKTLVLLLNEKTGLKIDAVEYYWMSEKTIFHKKARILNVESYIDAARKDVYWASKGIVHKIDMQSFGLQCETCPYRTTCFLEKTK